VWPHINPILFCVYIDAQKKMQGEKNMFYFFQSKYITDVSLYISVLLFFDTAVLFMLRSAYETWEAQTANIEVKGHK